MSSAEYEIQCAFKCEYCGKYMLYDDEIVQDPSHHNFFAHKECIHFDTKIQNIDKPDKSNKN